MSNQSSRQNVKVLHIGSSTPSMELVRWKCKSSGIEIESVAQDVALQYITRESPAVLLVEINYETKFDVKTIRDLAAHKIPIIALMTNSEGRALNDVICAGAADYIHENELTHTDLTTRIRFVLAKAEKCNKKRMSFASVFAVKPYLTCSF